MLTYVINNIINEPELCFLHTSNLLYIILSNKNNYIHNR